MIGCLNDVLLVKIYATYPTFSKSFQLELINSLHAGLCNPESSKSW